MPDYPENPQTDDEKAARAAYDAVQGQRGQPGAARGQLRPPRARVASSSYARKHPHSMGAWSPDSRLARRHDERRRLPPLRDVGHRRRGHHAAHRARGGRRHVTVLKEALPVLAGEIVDAAVMRKAALDAFLAEQVADAKERGRAVLRAPQGHDDEGLATRSSSATP